MTRLKRNKTKRIRRFRSNLSLNKDMMREKDSRSRGRRRRLRSRLNNNTKKAEKEACQSDLSEGGSKDAAQEAAPSPPPRIIPRGHNVPLASKFR